MNCTLYNNKTMLHVSAAIKMLQCTKQVCESWYRASWAVVCYGLFKSSTDKTTLCLRDYFLFEWKRRPDKSHVALNQWPVLKRHNCLFTAGSKSILASPALVHPYKCHADCGCLAAAVLEFFLLFFFVFCFFLFLCVTDGQQSQLLF